MGLNIRQHDDLDRVPPGAAPTGRVAPWAWAWPGWQVVLAGGGVGLALLGVLWLLDPRFVYITFGILAAGLAIRLILFVGVAGVRVPTQSALQMDAQQLAERGIGVHQTYAGAVTPAQLTYSPTMQPARAPESAAPPALPDAGAHLVSDAEWRGWMDKAPHLLIAGRTDAGKTTLATALMTDRALAGDELLILDPHYQPGKWAGLPAIGGGRGFEDILAMLPQLIRELNARYGAFERGQLTETFRRLTILIDEVPALVAACMEPGRTGKPQLVDMRWPKFAARLGSEARKVRMSVILLTQSTLVQDVMINSQLRDNYLRVGLGEQSAALLKEARDASVAELLRGQSYPAAMEWRGAYHALDTARVPELAARRVPAAIWTPPAPVSAQIPPTVRVSTPPSVPTQPMTVTNQEQILDVLRARARLSSTEIAKITGIDLNTTRKELSILYAARKIMRQPAREGNDRYVYSVTPLTASAQAGA